VWTTWQAACVEQSPGLGAADEIGADVGEH
jgi:hypothetical protein